MSKKKAVNLENGREALDILAAYDYQIVQFSQFHWRINNHLDVWPSTKKYFDRRRGKSGKYEELVEFVHEYLK